MAWQNPAQSSQSKFQETIVPRVLRVPFVPPRHLQSAKHKASHCTAACKSRSSVKWGCALRVVERQPLFCDSVVKDQIGSFLCHFPSAKHIFKASVACNGREVLRGTPEGRHGISAIEAADCLGNREPTIHWKVSRTSAACRVGSRKHLSPSAMRSEPVGRIDGFAVISRRRQSQAPSSLKREFSGVVGNVCQKNFNFFQPPIESALRYPHFAPSFALRYGFCERPVPSWKTA